MEQTLKQLSKNFSNIIELALCLNVDYIGLADLKKNGLFVLVDNKNTSITEWTDIINFYFKKQLIFTVQQIMYMEDDKPKLQMRVIKNEM